MSGAISRAVSWCANKQLAPLWTELARRAGASSAAIRQVRVHGLSSQGRRELASLLKLSRAPDATPVAVNIDKLCEALGLARDELRLFVEQLHGPLQDRAAVRTAYQRACEALWAKLTSRVGSRIPRTIVRLRSAGVPKQDVAAHAKLLGRLCDTLERLPLARDTPLPMLALEMWADPHALDRKTRAGAMLSAAALELCGLDPNEEDLLKERNALRQLRIVADRLSTPTLVWGVHATGSCVLDTMLRAGTNNGMPVHICGAILETAPPTFAASTWLCVENPSLIELAMNAGIVTPLVCTAGWPTETTLRLLLAARSQGIVLHYAGDFDPSGIRIAERMAQQLGATIRMSAQTYLAAACESGAYWESEPTSTPWDPQLRNAIATRRQVVYQECRRVWSELLAPIGDI